MKKLAKRRRRGRDSYRIRRERPGCRPTGRLTAGSSSIPCLPTGIVTFWVLPLEGDRTPFPYIQSPADDQSAVFSPDGKYVGRRSSRREATRSISRRSRPLRTNGRYQQTEGSVPIGHDGDELFYVQRRARLMSVEIKQGDPLGVGVPQPLVDFARLSRSPER